MAELLDLSAPSLDIRFTKGKYYQFTLYYLAPDRSIINLTGHTARMQARSNFTTNAILNGWNLTTENGGLAIVTGTATFNDGSPPVVGAYGVRVTLSSTVTSGSNWLKAIYEIDLINPSTQVLPFIQGELLSTGDGAR